MAKRKHLFGPVASRRLGRSLGVDPIPPKTCTFDCIYCEVGRTTHHTIARADYVPPEDILAEIEEFFASGGQADYVTFSGSGEPTLSRAIGALIRECKRRFRVPVAVITNGSLLADPAVREDLAEADLVIPSLDSAREETFRAVNRPLPGITVDTVIEGLVEFTKAFKGRVWLEVLLVDGVNDSPADIEALAEAVARIRPERVQLNTVIRPPAESFARPVSRKALESAAERLSKACPTEVIAPASVRVARKPGVAPKALVLETLARRPCTLEDLAAGLSIPVARTKEVLDALVGEGKIREVRFGSAVFYEPANRS